MLFYLKTGDFRKKSAISSKQPPAYKIFKALIARDQIVATLGNPWTPPECMSPTLEHDFKNAEARQKFRKTKIFYIQPY